MPLLALLPLLKDNWQLILKAIGVIVIAFFCWWFFVHNPKVIKELEKDKAELARIIETKDNQINLYKDIEKGKVVINAAVQSQISTLRSTARPRRTIIIRAGRVLPSVSQTTSPTN